jgi:hypothetical protein
MERKYSLLHVPAVSLATIFAMVFVTVTTIAGELSTGFKGALADMTGHHWVTKGVLALSLFIVIWLLSPLGLKDESRGAKIWSISAVGFAIAGMLAIFIFYTNHFLVAAH